MSPNRVTSQAEADHRWLALLPSGVRRWVAGRIELQAAAGNAGWLMFEKILRLGVGFVVTLWVARYLGPEDFGSLSFAFAFAALFGAVAGLGIDSLVVRDAVRHPGSVPMLLGTAFTLRVLGAVLAISVAVAAILYMRPDDREALWLVTFAATVYIFQAFDVIDLWFQAKLLSRYGVWAKSVALITVAGLKVGLILTGATVVAFGAAGLGEAVLIAVGLIVVYHVCGQSVRGWRPSVALARRLLVEGWPLTLSSVMVMLYMRMDQIMLGEMVGDGAVGIYTAATRLTEAAYFLPVVITASVAPALVRAKTAGETIYRARMQKLLAAMAIISYALIGMLVLLATPLIDVLFGAAYGAAASVLVVHAWALLFVAFGVASGQYLVIEGLTWLSLERTAVGGFVNVVLNWALIPAYGAVGAAAATLVSFAVSTFWLFRTARARVCVTMMGRALLLRWAA